MLSLTVPPLTHRRVPFATPGSMPYALPVMADYTYTGPGPGRGTPGRRGSSPTQQTPLGLIGQYTDYSERREQHLDLDFSRSLAAFDEEMRPKSARVALFEKSLASPGLTPIPGAHEVCGVLYALWLLVDVWVCECCG
jgi:hypothetical protein